MRKNNLKKDEQKKLQKQSRANLLEALDEEKLLLDNLKEAITAIENEKKYNLKLERNLKEQEALEEITKEKFKKVILGAKRLQTKKVIRSKDILLAKINELIDLATTNFQQVEINWRNVTNSNDLKIEKARRKRAEKKADIAISLIEMLSPNHQAEASVLTF